MSECLYTVHLQKCDVDRVLEAVSILVAKEKQRHVHIGQVHFTEVTRYLSRVRRLHGELKFQV